MNVGRDGKACHCDHGWIRHTIGGPVIDGERTVQFAYSPCRACKPDTADRVAVGLPRDDPAIERHRKRRDRITGRADD